MTNRIQGYFPEPPDRILATAYSIELKLIRGEDDDGGQETYISFDVRDTLAEDDAPLLAKLLAQFAPPAGKAGAQ